MPYWKESLLLKEVLYVIMFFREGTPRLFWLLHEFFQFIHRLVTILIYGMAFKPWCVGRGWSPSIFFFYFGAFFIYLVIFLIVLKVVISCCFEKNSNSYSINLEPGSEPETRFENFWTRNPNPIKFGFGFGFKPETR